jgi:uronate dehydrogenase
MRILITGGAGQVGRKIRRELVSHYSAIRSFDAVPHTPVASNEECVIGDITDMGSIRRAMDGVDGLIHLAAVANEAAFEPILVINVVGTWHVYEAARQAGVGRVVFGSSNHAVGFYPRAHPIDHTVMPRPDSRYGLSKCWGEAVASLYADKHGIRSLLVRIGNADDVPKSARALAIWISGRDLAQLCRIGLEHPDIHCDAVYGVSNNAASWYDNSLAHRLGYRPQDRAEDHKAEAMAAEAKLSHTPEDLHFMGGPFCSAEYSGPGIATCDAVLERSGKLIDPGTKPERPSDC